MADAVISVLAEEAVRSLVDSIATQLGYMWNNKTNFDNLDLFHLDKQLQKLQGRRDMVQHAAEEATRNGEETEQQVVNWLDSVNKMIDEAAEIIDENKQANMKCFKRLCPDLKKHYQHSKKAALKAKDVVGLWEDGKFDKVSCRTIPEEMWHPSSKLYEDFELRRSTVENILNALRNPDVNMVGVYGMGGIGKTTVAKEVGKQAEEQRLFVAVVFVEVYEEPDTMEIQGVIADRLGLQFQSNVLLILDNIWKGLDLGTVGIPFGNEHRGCACIEQHKSLAFEVAKRCGGLPIAIITIAKAFEDKPVHEWRSALGELKRPSAENLEGSVTAEAYSCIRLSYNHLETDELKSTFLLCSTIAFTYNASIENLLRYGMGLNLFITVYTMEEVGDRVNTLVQKLKYCSLLLDTPPNGEGFSIHDVVRDVGRSIAFKDHNQFTVIDGIILWEWKEKNILKSCTSIYLHDISELPNKELDCPLLKFLYMKGRNKYSKIPDNFFIRMLNLRVLHLMNMELSPLPTSLCCLVNLQTLCLNCSWLGDMGFIVNMKDLEILVLSCGLIGQLPIEIGKLTQLRVLDLTGLTQLEKLYMSYKFDNWHVEGVDNETKNASLDELKHLLELTTLQIRIPDAKIVQKSFFSQKLQRYKLCIGVEEWECYSLEKTPRLLQLKYGCANICIEDGVNMENVLYELDTDGFPHLKHFVVKSNPDLLYVIDFSKQWEPCVAFPQLETLYLYDLFILEKICDGQLTANSFCQLRSITITDCIILKNIFSSSISRHLSQLQEIEVEVASTSDQERQILETPMPLFDRKVFCNLDKLRLDGNNIIMICKATVLSEILFPKLKLLTIQDDKSTYLPLEIFQRSHNLEKLSLKCSSYKEIFLCEEDEKYMQIKNLRIICLKNLKQLWKQDRKMDAILQNLENLDVDKCNSLVTLIPPSSCFQNLTILRVYSCKRLLNLVSSSTAKSLIRLTKMRITDNEERVEDHEINFSKLKSLELICLSRLTSFSSLNYTFNFPSLEILTSQNCPKMKIFALGIYYCEGDVNTTMQQIQEYRVLSGERLSLSGREVKMILQKLPEHQFSKLKRLEVFDDESTVLSFGMLQRFHNLEKLKLTDSLYREILSREEYLDKLDNLEQMWKEDSKLNLILPNLEILKVYKCNNLITLIPASTSFQNLKTLRVWSILKDLSLISLSSLISFCYENYTLSFPSLEDLYLWKCPKMKFFSLGVTHTPILQKIQLDYQKYIWEGDLITTIRRIHEELNPNSDRAGPSTQHLE
ncbi:hypothetical protein ACOSQ3_021684 [Xanthoceras sorbifolium]